MLKNVQQLVDKSNEMGRLTEVAKYLLKFDENCVKLARHFEMRGVSWFHRSMVIAFNEKGKCFHLNLKRLDQKWC